MAKRKNNRKPAAAKEKKHSRFFLPEATKRLIWGVALLLLAVIVELYSISSVPSKLPDVPREVFATNV